MGKQHDTFPGEPEEMPEKKEQPEIKRPNDPDMPEIPKEDPQVIPDEFPPEENAPGEPQVKPI
jgi:hypothetical protein